MLISAQSLFAKKPPLREVKQIIPYQETMQMVGNKSINSKTGIVRSLSNIGYQAKSTSPENIAREYLQNNKDLFQLKNSHLSELKLDNIRQGLAVTTVRFKQYYDGLEVYQGDFSLSYNKSNIVNYVSNDLKPVKNFKQSKMLVSTHSAKTTALTYLKNDLSTQIQSISPVIYLHKNNYITTYKIETTSKNRFGNWLFLIDANSGQVLMAKDTLHYQNATATVFDPDPLSSSGANYGSGYVDNGDVTTSQLDAELFPKDLTLETSGSTFFLKNQWAESVDIDGPFDGIFSQSSSNFNYHRADDAFESVNVLYHIDNFLNYLNNDLGLNVKPYQYATGVKFDAHGDNGADNSFYNTGSGSLVFGEGCVDDAEDADVIIHELGHGIHDWITQGGLSQVNGLSEGTGDYFAQSYSRSRPNQVWNSNQAAYHYMFSWDGHNECWAGRTTNYAPVYPTGLVNQIHTDGQIWSSCLMKIWDQVGRENTDMIVVEGLAMTSSTTNQEQAAQAVLQAAVDLGLNEHINTIQSTFAGCGYTLNNVQPTFNATISNSGDSTISTTQNFSAVIANGVAPYQYAWDVNNDGAIDGTEATISANYSHAYNDNVTLTVTDSMGSTSTNTLAVNIQSPNIDLFSSSAINPALQQICGNNNGFIDPGERWRAPVSFQNSGSTDAINANAVFKKSSGMTGFVETAKDDFGNAIGTCGRTFIDISTTGTELTIIDANPSDDFPAQDEGVATVNLSQPFDLYGRTINSLYLSTNGYISTNSSESGFDFDNDCPIPAVPNNSGNGSTTSARIIPMHSDLITQHIYHQHFTECPRSSGVSGALACDVFMYNDVDLFSENDDSVESFNFEAILYPDINLWVYQYDGTGFNPAASTIGLQNDNATDGVALACNTADSINTQQAVCVYHKDNQAIASSSDTNKFYIETPVVTLGDLAVSEQFNGSIDFSIDENASCGLPIGIDLQAVVYNQGFNQSSSSVLATELGNNGVCSVVSNCMPNSSNDIQPTNGLWYNPRRSGNGNDMHFTDNGLVYIQYTALADRSPIWYITSSGVMQNNQVENDVLKVSYNGPFLTSTQSTESVGSSTTTLIDANNAIQTRTINGKFSADLMNSFVFSNDSTPQQRTGLWYNAGQSGWGQTIGTQGDVEVIVNYLYNNSGQPYWVLGAGINSDIDDINMQYSDTFCPHCPVVPIKTIADPVGSVRINYDGTNQSATLEAMQINVSTNKHESQWERTNLPLTLLTAPIE
jgi:Zn-dependent metalloprotease